MLHPELHDRSTSKGREIQFVLVFIMLHATAFDHMHDHAFESCSGGLIVAACITLQRMQMMEHTFFARSLSLSFSDRHLLRQPLVTATLGNSEATSADEHSLNNLTMRGCCRLLLKLS